MLFVLAPTSVVVPNPTPKVGLLTPTAISILLLLLVGLVLAAVVLSTIGFLLVSVYIVH